MTDHETASQPSIGICIPTRGRTLLMSDALPSVLRQMGPADRVVIAGHGDAVDLGDLGRDARLSTIVHCGGAVGAARNAAAAAAGTDVLLFLDDDDEMLDGALAEVRRLMIPTHVGFCSGTALLAERGGTESVHPPQRQGLLHREVVAQFLAGSFAVRREVFEAIGGYDPDLRFGENYELGMRVADHLHRAGFEAVATDVALLRYRPSRSDYTLARLEGAETILDRHGARLPFRCRERADLHAIASVQGLRLGRIGVARAHARQAVSAQPSDPRHWFRFATLCLPVLGPRMLRRRGPRPDPRR